MNVTVDAIRFVRGHLQVKKQGEWVPQICMFNPRANTYVHCGEQCPLCHQDFDGCVILCQDRLLLPRHKEEEKGK